MVDATGHACRSRGLELPLRFGMHRFQRHHAGNPGGGHGAAVVGKRGRQGAARQVAGAAGPNLGDLPVGDPAAAGAIAPGSATGQSIATKENDHSVARLGDEHEGYRRAGAGATSSPSRS